MATSSVMVRRSVWFLPKPLMRSPKRRKKSGMAAPCASAPRLPAAMSMRSHLSANENSSWNATACSALFFPSPRVASPPPPFAAFPSATADSAIGNALASPARPRQSMARLALSGRRRGASWHWGEGTASPLSLLSWAACGGAATASRAGRGGRKCLTGLGCASVSVTCRRGLWGAGGGGGGAPLCSALRWSGQKLARRRGE